MKCIYSMIPLKKHDTYFILNRKKRGEGKLERERTDRVWEVECSRERVAVGVISLIVGQVFIRAPRRDTPESLSRWQ
jgi:hypothetical protein